MTVRQSPRFSFRTGARLAHEIETQSARFLGSRRTLAEYGVELEFESEQVLFHELEVMRESRSRLYLAEVEGEPVGVGGLRPLTADEAEIKRMYVRPSARGLGVGRAILVRLIDDARALGYKAIRLDSAPFMHEAHARYRSYGFVPSSPHEGWEFESVPALRDVRVVFMSLDLGPGQRVRWSRVGH